MADEEGREQRSEDLFEDLDKFFAPIQDVDWPEEGAEGREPGVAGAEPPRERDDARDLFPETTASGETPPPEPAEDLFDSGSGGVSGEGEDLLADEWVSGLSDDALDLDVPPAGEGPGGFGAPSRPEEGGFGDASSGPGPSQPEGRSAGEPTAEMSGQDWEDLRGGAEAEERPAGREGEPFSFMEQFLPDAEEGGVPEFGYTPAPGEGGGAAAVLPGTGEPIEFEEPDLGAGPPAEPPADTGVGEEGEPSGPITIDDLRRAPEAYRDLPGPEPGPGPGPEPEPGPGPEPGPVPGEDLGHEPAPTVAGLPGPEEPPPPEAVEAAAEHFAASIRDEELGRRPPEEGGLDELFGPPPGEPGPARVADEYGDREPAAGGYGGEIREPYSEHPEPLLIPEEEEHLLPAGEGPRTVKVGTSETVGPSWQEPTSVEVPGEGEVEPPRPRRNLPAAILTGLILAVLGLGSMAIGKGAFAIVAGGVALLAQLELYTAMRARGFQPAVPLGLAVGGLIVAAGYLKGEAAMASMLALGAVFTPLWYMAIPAKSRRAVVANMGATLFGLVAVPFLAGYVLVILAGTSRAFTIVILVLAFGYDIGAFAVGSLTGDRPLAPSISPNKTREGAIGGFLVVLIFSVVVTQDVAPITNYVEAIGLTFAASLAALLGDLAESLMKRDLGVKDMGTILPGHGGALDRIDSILFVAPVAYWFIRVFVL